MGLSSILTPLSWNSAIKGALLIFYKKQRKSQKLKLFTSSRKLSRLTDCCTPLTFSIEISNLGTFWLHKRIKLNCVILDFLLANQKKTMSVLLGSAPHVLWHPKSPNQAFTRKSQIFGVSESHILWCWLDNCPSKVKTIRISLNK